jgi:hypothetical protein
MRLIKQPFENGGKQYTIYVHPSLDYFSVREGQPDEEVKNGFELTVQNVYSGNHSDELIEQYETEDYEQLGKYIADNWDY